MKVIGIVGYPASGKGEFSDTAKALGIPVFVMGDIIRKKTVEAGLELTDANIGETARALRAEFGMDAVASLTAAEVEQRAAPLAVIDGIRGDAEIQFFKNTFADFTAVFVSASFETRLSRMKTRGRSDDTAEPETLRARDAREESFGLKRAAEIADVVIKNESDRESYLAEVKAFLGGLL